MLLSHSECLLCEGIGEYRYYRYPSLSMLQGLREGFYLMLARVANRWFELGIQHEIILLLEFSNGIDSHASE